MIEFKSLTAVLCKNFGRPGEDKNKREKVNPYRLWDMVLNRRAEDVLAGKNKVIDKALKALQRAGLEDPFERIPEVRRHVKLVLAECKSKSQLEKAITLFRSMVPSDIFINVEGKSIAGLKSAEGGLEIPRWDHPKDPFMRKYPSPLPKELLRAPKSKRIAGAVEYLFLLATLLREAGIKAGIRTEGFEVCLVAKLDGENYKFDMNLYQVTPCAVEPGSDREAMAVHYVKRGFTLAINRNVSEAQNSYDFALEMNPEDVVAMQGKGMLFVRKGEYDEAIKWFKRALNLNPELGMVWSNLGTVYDRLCNFQEALKCFSRAVEVDPENRLAWENKAKILKYLGRMKEAESCLSKAQSLLESEISAKY